MMIPELLKDVKTVGISGHVKPDGDCVGSCLGLSLYIQKYFPEIETTVFLEEIPEVFHFLNGASKIQHLPVKDSFDLYFALDCGDLKRLGDFAVHFENAKKTVCIDHHKSNDSFADINIIVPEFSSTSELIFNHLPKDDITKEIAECLYVGMVHDTGVFQYSSTTADTMNAAGFLMEKGIDYSGIIDRTYYEKTFVQNKILGYATMNAELFGNGEGIVTCITLEDLDKFGATKMDLEGIVNQIRLTKGVEVAVFIHQTDEEEYKISLRSKARVDLSVIAQSLGGGGHQRAAGCSVTGSLENVKELILSKVTAALQKS